MRIDLVGTPVLDPLASLMTGRPIMTGSISCPDWQDVKVVAINVIAPGVAEPGSRVSCAPSDHELS